MLAQLLNLNLHLRIVGLLLLALLYLNTQMPKRFHWNRELPKLDLLTRQIFIVHALFIGLIVLMMAILSLAFTPLLLRPSPLAAVILAGLAFFWLFRLAAQFLIYSPKLWRGNRFNTAMHVLFSCLWAYFAAVYTAAFIHAFHG
jgi:hypothetical protein